jgi:hypothetical protein
LITLWLLRLFGVTLVTFHIFLYSSEFGCGHLDSAPAGAKTSFQAFCSAVITLSKVVSFSEFFT